jgi:hypothetical protein
MALSLTPLHPWKNKASINKMALVPSATWQLAGRLLGLHHQSTHVRCVFLTKKCGLSGVKRSHVLVLLLVIDNPDPIDPLPLRRKTPVLIYKANHLGGLARYQRGMTSTLLTSVKTLGAIHVNQDNAVHGTPAEFFRQVDKIPSLLCVKVTAVDNGKLASKQSIPSCGKALWA